MTNTASYHCSAVQSRKIRFAFRRQMSWRLVVAAHRRNQGNAGTGDGTAATALGARDSAALAAGTVAPAHHEAASQSPYARGHSGGAGRAGPTGAFA
jgi:hypothetical protein